MDRPPVRPCPAFALPRSVACPEPMLIVRRDQVSCSAAVFVDQSAEYRFTVDLSSRVDDPMRSLVRWQLLAALVRPVVVVVRLELSQDSAQVSVSRDQQVVQTFSARGTDEPLGVFVRSRGLDRRLDDPDTGRGEH